MTAVGIQAILTARMPPTTLDFSLLKSTQAGDLEIARAGSGAGLVWFWVSALPGRNTSPMHRVAGYRPVCGYPTGALHLHQEEINALFDSIFCF
jgi:hypothetical protein